MRKVLVVMLAISILMTGMIFSKTVVTFWESMGGDLGKTLSQIVDTFNSQHANIEVKAIYVGSYATLQQKLLASAVGGGLPTMSQVYSNWTAALMKSNVIQPMQTFIDNPQIGLSQSQLNDIWEPFLKANTWNGKIYTLPFNKSIYIMYVNQDALALAGVSIPKTVPELIKDLPLLTIKDSSGKVIQYALGLRTTVDTFEVFLRQNGADFINSDYTKATLDTPVALETLQTLVDMIKTGDVLAQGGYLDGPFGNGQIAMYIDTSAGLSYTANSVGGKFSWTIAPVPAWKTQAPPFAGTDLAIFNTASPAEQEAAWEFVKFLLSPQIQAFWAIKTGYLPVTKSAVETQAWKDYAASNPMANILVSQIPYGSSDPGIAAWSQIRNDVGTLVSDAMFFKKTPQEALQLAQQEVTKDLQSQ
ncbi:ABC transporter substrate-binding protein [Athalassotoga saccharophila]|uniref:ABC transporter substrate-binding protein n=1 Tax=Athalassotoga saccharophila TaxID=1441386 RepID=UPI00137B25D8|nr:ABC transporter substrate-binding protein [Athalassotoga saccharophila]BBJ28518.1 sn-glycerol-3-phosphate-binding periplasmic protein UgpB [Athalassotoga saccharophila]